MDHDHLPNNSKNPKITTGRVIRTKNDDVNPFAKHTHDIFNNLYKDIVLPALKDTITSFVMGVIESMLYGGDVNDRSHNRTRGRRVNYTQYSNRGSRKQNNRTKHVKRIHRYEDALHDIRFDNDRDADAVLAGVLEYISQYGVCKVGDFLSMCGFTTSPIDFRYGWTDFQEAEIIRHGMNSYGIDMPPPEEIN